MGCQDDDDDDFDERQREQDEAAEEAIDDKRAHCAHCGEALPPEKYEDPLQAVFRHVECPDCHEYSKLSKDPDDLYASYESEVDDPPPPYVLEDASLNGQQGVEKGASPKANFLQALSLRTSSFLP